MDERRWFEKTPHENHVALHMYWSVNDRCWRIFSGWRGWFSFPGADPRDARVALAVRELMK